MANQIDDVFKCETEKSTKQQFVVGSVCLENCFFFFGRFVYPNLMIHKELNGVNNETEEY